MKKAIFIGLIFLGTFFWGVTLDGQRIDVFSIEDPKSFNKATKRVKKLFNEENLNFMSTNESHEEMGKHMYTVYADKDIRGYLYISSTAACSFGGCSGPLASDYLKASDDIHFYVILDENRTIVHLCITDFESTYGYEIAARSWLKRFFGQKADETVQVDGITGATISSEAMLNAIKEISIILKEDFLFDPDRNAKF